MNARIKRLRESFDEWKLESLFVTRPEDVRYLCGFTGEAVLIVDRDRVRLIADSRFTEAAAREVPGAELVERKADLYVLLGSLKIDPTGFGIDSSHMTHRMFLGTVKALKGEPSIYKDPVSRLRIVKDAGEVELMKKAAAVAREAFDKLRAMIHPGMTEKDVSDELEYLTRKAGATCSAFPAIISAGPNSSMPHHVTSDRKIEETDMVLIDWGAIVDGYVSDTTRMVFFGEPDDQQRRFCEAVFEAQSRGLAAIAPGVSCRDVDAAARDFLKEEGLADLFSHGIGHGVGLVVHEVPRLSPLSRETLEEGMVITIEPALYRRGWGGVRIEDMAVVTSSGFELLTDRQSTPLG